MHEVKDAFDALARAPGKTKWLNDNSFMKQNPITKERTPSCQVTLKDGRIWFHDWGSGISFKEFCEALGVDYYAAIGNSKKRTRHSIADRIAYGFRDYLGEGVRATIYDYTDEEYNYLYSRVRLEGGSKQDGEHLRKKEFYFYLIDYAGETYQKCDEKKGIKIPRRVLYRLPKLIQALNAGRTVYIAEGEKDIHTLESLGYTATCAGASGDWKPEYGRIFKGARLVICPDNDTSGGDYLEAVKRSVKWYAHSVKTVYTCKREHGDITDYIQDGNTAENFDELVDEAETEYAPWIDVTVGKAKATLKINTDILAKTILHNENHILTRNLGEEKDVFLFYGKRGIYERYNRNAIKAKIKEYLPMGFATDNALNNTVNLLFASVDASRIMPTDKLDSDENLIVLENGIYDIRKRELVPFSPDYLVTRSLHCSYHPDAKDPKEFLAYLDALCTTADRTIDRDEQMAIQEEMGLMLSNVAGFRVKRASVFAGVGNTGKTVLLNLNISIIGAENVCNVGLKDMNENSRFAVGSALGKRLIAIGDESSAEIKDVSLFKQLTGGDMIKFEMKGVQPIYSRFTGVIVLAVNVLPTISDDKGDHLFSRLMILPCCNVIPEEKRDPFLSEKLFKERDEIFAWALKGLHRLIDNEFHFTRCKASEKANEEYRSRLDTVFRFITEKNYVITGDYEDKVRKDEFDKAYETWCIVNHFTQVKSRNLKDRLAGLKVTVHKGQDPDDPNIQGVMLYRRIRKMTPKEIMDKEKTQDGDDFKTDDGEGGLVFG